MVHFDAFVTTAFSPEVELHVDSAVFEEPVALVNQHLNTLGSKYFKELADNSANSKFSNTQYAVVGSADSSQEEAILMPGTYANGLWPHIFARAEAIRLMAEERRLSDRYGNPLPVVMVASPSVKSNFNLTPLDRTIVSRNGDYTSIADRHLHLLDNLGYRAFRSVLYSGASALGGALVQEGQRYMDVKTMAVGEPPHVDKHSSVRSVAQFISEGPGFKKALRAEGIDVINELFGDNNSDINIVKNIFAERAENTALMRGYRHGGLYRMLKDASHIQNSGRIVLLHASDSHVTPKDKTIRAYSNARSMLPPSKASKLRRVEILGANHSLGDRIGRFAVINAGILGTQ